VKRKPENTAIPLAANLLGAAILVTLVGSFWALVEAVDWSGNVTSHRTRGTAPYKGYESKEWGMGDRFLELFGFDSESAVIVSQALLWTSRLGFVVTAVLIFAVARVLMSARATK
jgi:hypothetical protein